MSHLIVAHGARCEASLSDFEHMSVSQDKERPVISLAKRSTLLDDSRLADREAGVEVAARECLRTPVTAR